MRGKFGWPDLPRPILARSPTGIFRGPVPAPLSGPQRGDATVLYSIELHPGPANDRQRYRGLVVKTTLPYSVIGCWEWASRRIPQHCERA
ncbi:hypothetical protein SEA_HANNACONDA_175 [Mycobacterium phage Hannaconda]|nr:hypothetical protein SEA_HANNACONDA_175 [Mycobacterium phage Hannaconda]QPO16841.1 hypothetical protein SEA_KASHFLOW_180 [Mycobacterium phage KashFlow]